MLSLDKTKDINEVESFMNGLPVFFHYGTDANAAIRAGNNVYAAAFGMAVINSHGKERCHIDSIVDTTKLAIAYALDL